MAKQATVSEAKPGILTRLKSFRDEVWVEMRKVTWPSMDELKSSTQVVLLMLGIIAAIIFVYDKVFSVVMQLLFRLA